jgi:hypothetical protein
MWSGNIFDTWLYNKNESIWLEISPIYPWHFRDPKEGEIFVPYKEWIKSYKPVCIVEIQRKIAQQWLSQAKSIMEEIEKADSVYLYQK